MSNDKVLGKRYRGEDHVTGYRVVPTLVDESLYQRMLFMENKRCIDKHHEVQVKKACLVIKNKRRLQEYSITGHYEAEVLFTTANVACPTVSILLPQEEHRGIERIDAVYTNMLVFMRGMLPNMGRREHWWVDVDAYTKKRVDAPKQSPVYTAFSGPLGERNVLRIVLKFLC